MNNFMNLPHKAYNNNFMWIAEYLNGTLFCEYDVNTLIQNQFKDIKKENLIRFGMFGFGYKVYFDISTGIYYEIKKINNNDVINTYKVLYLDEDGIEYDFMGDRNTIYNDLIQFKSSSLMLKLNLRQDINWGKGFNQQVENYNFGYKTKLQINNINFNFQTIMTFNPHNSPLLLQVKLVSDKKLNGNLIFRKNGFQDFKYYAPLEIGNAGIMNWVVR